MFLKYYCDILKLFIRTLFVINSNQDKKALANLLYELSNLNHIQRSGLVQFCYDNFETIAAHSHKVACIAYFLGTNLGANIEKVLTIALFHDATETRVSDINWIQKKYTSRNESLALHDQYAVIADSLKSSLLKLLEEYEIRQSLESKIVKDSDYIAYYITLRELEVKGNLEAKRRVEYETKDLNYMYLPESKELLREILKTDPNEWTRKLHIGTLKRAEVK